MNVAMMQKSKFEIIQEEQRFSLGDLLNTPVQTSTLLLLLFVLTATANARDTLPPVNTDHLVVMSDERGICEFARGRKPDFQRFCIEDTARALVATLKIHAIEPTRDTERLAGLYLDAITGLQNADGKFRFGYKGSEGPLPRMAQRDQFARVLWSLGHASADGINNNMRTRAQAMFEKALPHLTTQVGGGALERSYALQGLHCFLQARPGMPAARQMLRDYADSLIAKLPSDPAQPWQWPSDVITYDSARLPLALLLAFETTKDTRYRKYGIRVLNCLAAVNFPRDGKMLHVIGNRGWYRRGRAPADFDQQPIDVSGLVEACSAAWRITHDEIWRARGVTAFEWFLGNNTGYVAIYDPDSGGCRDGLGRNGPNSNQGGESTSCYWIARCEVETLTTP